MAQIILFNPSNGLILDKLDIWPPWPLLYISVKLHTQYSITIIDGRREKHWRQILDRELNQDTICVGATSLTGLQLRYTAEFLREVKRRRPSVTTVVGGPHVTSLPLASVREPFVDVVVVGDGETSFYNLVKAIDATGSYDHVKGICYKDETGTPVATPAQDYENLESLGAFPLHLIDMPHYISTEYGRRKFILLTSRGCPFGCSYCYNSNSYHRGRWRCISAPKIIELIKSLISAYGIGYFVFQDDNFWVNPRRIDDFVALLEAEGLDIKWAVYGATIANLRQVGPDFALRLKRSGLIKVLCGIETASPRIQRLVGKCIDIADVLEVDRIMRQVGVKMIYSFMCGFPTETDEDIRMNIDVMLRIRKASPRHDVGNMKPLIYYPGTKLFDWALENGFTPPGTFEGWSEYTLSNYGAADYPWISAERRTFLQRLYFATLLLNPDYEYIRAPIWKLVSRLLYPITEWRVRHLFFRFSPVLSLMTLLKRVRCM
jgi:anaerobic magnesium-protoporphyrin IX monomethyl ester cyclase